MNHLIVTAVTGKYIIICAYNNLEKTIQNILSAVFQNYISGINHK